MHEQAAKVKKELLELDGLFQEARRISLFKAWDERWNGTSMDDRFAELTEATKKGDLLTKVLKNLMSGLKG